MSFYNTIVLPLLIICTAFVSNITKTITYSPTNFNQGWNKTSYFNTHFLSNPKAVKPQMIADGFQSHTLMTSDGVKLDALYLAHPHAQYTLVMCCGWPGAKEAVAPWYAMLADQPCNMIFFDARTVKTTRLISQRIMWRYGLHEYQDILAALNFVHEKTSLPIFILATCAGAFNAAHALVRLTKENTIKTFNIKGFICDSGWASVSSTALTAFQGKARDYLLYKILCPLYKTRDVKKLSTTYAYRIITPCTNTLLYWFYRSLLKSSFQKHHLQTNLFDKIMHISLPIFFIHSLDDTQTPCINAQKLADLTPNKECWWIDQPSRHSLHHIKHKYEYKQRVLSFFKKHLLY